MNNITLIEQLPNVRGAYRENVDLSKLCWFQVGGKAKVFYKPHDADDLAYFLANKPKNIPHFVFGVGSNTLIRDKGFDGVIIRLGRNFNYVNFEGCKVSAGAATLDLNVALGCVEQGIGGLEFLSGIPGTIGGALAMNAGAYGREIKDILISAQAINDKGEIANLSNEDFGFYYRGKSLTGNWIFTAATFQGEKADKQHINAKVREIQNQRLSTQPIKTRTGGSTFKNPADYKAWQLIDVARCRGLKIGGAQVSELHCNFIINTGNATAKDLEDLIIEVKRRVLNATGITLEEEIKIIGH